jgi:hypothetical protein
MGWLSMGEVGELASHGAWPCRAVGGPAVQAMPAARTGEEGARRTRVVRQTNLGGWEGRRLTGVGYLWWRAGGQSAQWWQTGGEATASGEMLVSSRTQAGCWRRWRSGDSVPEAARPW